MSSSGSVRPPVPPSVSPSVSERALSRPPSHAFTPHEQRLMRRLWASQGKPLLEVAQEFGLSVPQLVDEMRDVTDLGLVDVGEDGVVRMTPPREALSSLLAAETATMEATMARLNRMGSLVVALGQQGEPSRSRAEALADGASAVDVEIVQGRPPSDVLQEWIAAGHGDLRFLRPEQWRLPTEPLMAQAFRGALAQGVSVRAIYPVRALHLARSVLEEHRATGEEMRLLPEVPHQMALVGTGHAMVVSGLGGEELHTLVIREPLIVRVLVAYFDSLWDQGTAMPAGDEPRDRSEERRLLLHELARGERDEQIARSLGLGLRTVRRRVADLMIDLGVETRFQAGVEAARRGWI